MIIQGYQKLTALDFPGKLACTVFTPGCNFRCPFCHNASLVRGSQEPPISEDEVFAHLNKRVGMLDGVCLTGGEPLLQKGLDVFLQKVKQLGYLVKLDTNGSLPEQLKQLIENGLVDYVAMDLKNCREKYPLTCGVENLSLDSIEQSIELLMQGKVDYEFRTTVVNELHTVEDIASAGEWIRGAKQWFLQCYKDSGDVLGSGLTAPSKETLQQMLEIAAPFVQRAELRGV